MRRPAQISQWFHYSLSGQGTSTVGLPLAGTAWRWHSLCLDQDGAGLQALDASGRRTTQQWASHKPKPRIIKNSFKGVELPPAQQQFALLVVWHVHTHHAVSSCAPATGQRLPNSCLATGNNSSPDLGGTYQTHRTKGTTALSRESPEATTSCEHARHV